MRDETIGGWLDELASSAPAPGGGAAGALEVGIAAALVEMVCNLTIGKPAYAGYEETMIAARARATTIRSEAIRLAAEDAEAFSAVIAAYRLPKETEAEIAERAARVQAALALAADVPRRTAVAASEVLDLAERIVPGSNVNVVSDAGAAAGAARGALSSALVNIDANRASITDPRLLAELDAAVDAIERDLARADRIVAAVRKRTAR
ncbi:MAG TPA: cyclodeaminase/cyclohydrolase family protein [Gaiellaceae bacterium]|nr:cyclodeaminase/cyclohydrolase family protein [Gaiellaceae bacterium]